MQYLYLITNTQNGKIYVGLTEDPEKRWKKHQADSNYRGKYEMYRSMKKNGIGTFKFTVIATAPDRDTIARGEKSVIHCLKTLGFELYNLTDGGENPPSQKGKSNNKGRKQSPEHIAKLSAAKKGKPSPLKGIPTGRTPWNKGKQGVQTAWNLGKPWSEETKAKQSLARLGVEPWNKGLVLGPQDPETVAKRSAKLIGVASKLRTLTFEQAQEIRAKYAAGVKQSKLVQEYDSTRKIIQGIVMNWTYKGE